MTLHGSRRARNRSAGGWKRLFFGRVSGCRPKEAFKESTPLAPPMRGSTGLPEPLPPSASAACQCGPPDPPPSSPWPGTTPSPPCAGAGQSSSAGSNEVDPLLYPRCRRRERRPEALTLTSGGISPARCAPPGAPSAPHGEPRPLAGANQTSYPLGFAMAFSGVADLAPENARGRMSRMGKRF